MCTGIWHLQCTAIGMELNLRKEEKKNLGFFSKIIAVEDFVCKDTFRKKHE